MKVGALIFRLYYGMRSKKVNILRQYDGHDYQRATTTDVLRQWLRAQGQGWYGFGYIWAYVLQLSLATTATEAESM